MMCRGRFFEPAATEKTDTRSLRDNNNIIAGVTTHFAGALGPARVQFTLLWQVAMTTQEH